MEGGEGESEGKGRGDARSENKVSKGTKCRVS